MEPRELSQALEAGQVGLDLDTRTMAWRLERALAAQTQALVTALAEAQPELGAGCLAVMGGVAAFAGAGSPFTQGVALGLEAGALLDDAALSRLEGHLAPRGGAVQVEVTPFADPALAVLLGRRGYRITEWQLVWARPLPGAPWPGARFPGELRLLDAAEARAGMRVLMEGFLGVAPPEEVLDLLAPVARVGETWMTALEGQDIGGGTLFTHQGTALLGGAATLPAFRCRGAQQALVARRLDRAAAQGCDLAACSTLAGTPSARNLERAGFRVAYPKVVMVKDL